MNDFFTIMGALILLALFFVLVFLGTIIWKKTGLPGPGSYFKTRPGGRPGQAAGLSPGWAQLVKLAFVAALTLVMLAPLSMILDLVREREHRQRNAVWQIQNEWAGGQTFRGPLLLVPVTYSWQVAENVAVLTEQRPAAADSARGDDGALPPTAAENHPGGPAPAPREAAPASRTAGVINTVYKERTATRLVVIAPKTLDILGDMSTETRRLGIYEAAVYSASLEVIGRFVLPSTEDLARLEENKKVARVDWAAARIIASVSDQRGLKAVRDLVVDGVPAEAGPSGDLGPGVPAGFAAAVDLTGKTSAEFAFSVLFNGSGSVYFSPMGEATTVALKSSWPHPGFGGSRLPDEREISAGGFKASWIIPSLAHSYPSLELAPLRGSSSRDSEDREDAGYAVGVTLVTPADSYALIERAVKFGCLFVALTFLVVVLSELKNGRDGGGGSPRDYKLHPLQYGVVGLALALFYLALLSLSEHVRFGPAYLVSAAVIVLMIGAYAYGATRRADRAGIVVGMTAFLYAILYLILIQEDYALLSGTALLTAALVSLMVLTRKVNQTSPAPADGEENETDGPGHADGEENETDGPGPDGVQGNVDTPKTDEGTAKDGLPANEEN
ncbi:MAG: inner membrane CreD family protein [Deltaproteobacteria bacterium]|jgi:inner membrane protein|nr:inner membrane CreD family protein [Deltaproteobacteria bacterium]